MDLGLNGLRAVVTGGSSGIGLATVRGLLADGARVAFCGRDEDRLVNAFDPLAAEYGDAVLALPCDVLDESQVENFRDAVLDRFGGLDILVNNAGQARMSTFADTDDDAWRNEFELKFFSIIRPVRAFGEALQASDHGAIVVVNSLLARQPEPHLVCTSALRSGVLNLVKSLSVELAPRVRVNGILIGTVDSGQWQKRYEARAEPGQTKDEWLREEAAKRRIPLGRFGTPDEAASAAVFLAAPAASFITGASLEVAGGVSRFA